MKRLSGAILRGIVVLGLCGLGFVLGVYLLSELKINRIYDIPLTDIRTDFQLDATAGERMAKIVGCWAGCHGLRGEGGVEEIPGIRKVTAPPLGSVIPDYTDAQLYRLILHGIKRDGRSAIGMSSYTFWPLGDADVANIIYFLRQQPSAEAVRRRVEIPFRSRMLLLKGDWALSADQVDKSQPRWGNRSLDSSYERGRYLAAIVCAECHGADYLGDTLEGGPPLTVLAAYEEQEFARLLTAGISRSGVPVEAMSWLPAVEFTSQDIEDLYNYLTQKIGVRRVEHHRVRFQTRRNASIDVEPDRKTETRPLKSMWKHFAAGGDTGTG